MLADVGRSLVTDYYLIDELLTDEEKEIRDRVRSFADREVIPVINDYWERAEFPFEMIPKIAALNIAGGTIKGYGCPGISEVASGLVAVELARGDGSLNTFFGVHSGLAMGTIAMLGSEEQKERWLPPMARCEKIGAFGLTEPNHGSDAVMLETREARWRRVRYRRREALDRQRLLRGRHRYLGPRRRGRCRRLPRREGHARSLHRGHHRQDLQALRVAG